LGEAETIAASRPSEMLTGSGAAMCPLTASFEWQAIKDRKQLYGIAELG
jgi:hypothetical protein